MNGIPRTRRRITRRPHGLCVPTLITLHRAGIAVLGTALAGCRIANGRGFRAALRARRRDVDAQVYA